MTEPTDEHIEAVLICEHHPGCWCCWLRSALVRLFATVELDEVHTQGARAAHAFTMAAAIRARQRAGHVEPPIGTPNT